MYYLLVQKLPCTNMIFVSLKKRLCFINYSWGHSKDVCMTIKLRLKLQKTQI